MSRTRAVIRTEIQRQMGDLRTGDVFTMDVDKIAAAVDAAHAARVTEMVEAGIRAKVAFSDVPIGKFRIGRRIPGLPTDTSATAIGYDKDGRPWIMDWFEGADASSIGGPLSARWEACGPYMRQGGIVTADGVVDCHEHPDFIVEHEIVEIRK